MEDQFLNKGRSLILARELRRDRQVLCERLRAYGDFLYCPASPRHLEGTGPGGASDDDELDAMKKETDNVNEIPRSR
jgi:hypothetical protein